MTTDNLNLSGYEELTVDFSYYPVGMDSNEDFWLQVSTDGGSTYNTIETWVRGTDFNNNISYSESVTITGTFTSTTKVRFRVDASVNNDRVYFDDVTLTGCVANSRGGGLTVVDDDTTSPSTILDLFGRDEPIIKYPVDELPIELGSNYSLNVSKLASANQLMVYPNPAVNMVKVDLSLLNTSFDVNLTLVDVNGRVIIDQKLTTANRKQAFDLNVEALPTGFYFINVISNNLHLTKKLTIVD